MSNSTKLVVTCDYEWAEHGRNDGATPTDAFSNGDVRDITKHHMQQFPTHVSFRVWKFASRRNYQAKKKQS